MGASIIWPTAIEQALCRRCRRRRPSERRGNPGRGPSATRSESADLKSLKSRLQNSEETGTRSLLSANGAIMACGVHQMSFELQASVALEVHAAGADVLRHSFR